MRRSHNTSALLATLKQSGVDPLRLRAHIQESLEIEYAVLYANRNKIPDKDYLEKKLTMIEAEIFILLLSEAEPV